LQLLTATKNNTKTVIIFRSGDVRFPAEKAIWWASRLTLAGVAAARFERRGVVAVDLQKHKALTNPDTTNGGRNRNERTTSPIAARRPICPGRLHH
jgi:hypothetical protein